MSEQTISKSVHEIPSALINSFKICYKQEIDKVEFLRSYQDIEGLWKVFKVNEQFVFYVLNGRTGDFTTLEKEEKKKKAFGKRVKYVMKEANVPWELAKIAVRMNLVNDWYSESTANARALGFIEEVNDALQRYLKFSKKRMSVEDYLEYHASDCLKDLTDKEKRIIRAYWLSQGA